MSRVAALSPRQRSQPTARGYIDPARPNLAFMRFACSPNLRKRLMQRADEERISMSEVIRRACREYVGREYVR